MPNWCCNKIFIEGNYKNLRSISDVLNFYLSEESSDCEIGIFEKLLGVNPKIIYDDYDDEVMSNIQYWGTKWDVFELDEYKVNCSDNFIDIEIDTANSPPIEFCKKLSKKYNVSINIVFYELGLEFAGECVINDLGEEIGYTPYKDINEAICCFDSNFWD